MAIENQNKQNIFFFTIDNDEHAYVMYRGHERIEIKTF